MQLSFSKDAEQDIAGIAAFSLERWNADQATRYTEALIAECELLCVFPRLGSIVEGRLKGLRRYTFRQHVVLYMPEEQVRVLRILHHRRRESKGKLIQPK